MESEKAYRSLLKVSKEKKFEKLGKYLQQSKCIEINLSSLPLVEYLASVVVSQQLSTKAAKTIWSRVHPIVESYKDYENLESALREAGLSTSKANYVIGMISNSHLQSMHRADLLKMSNIEFEKILIDESLKASNGIKIEAAKLLGWGRNTLARKAKNI